MTTTMTIKHIWLNIEQVYYLLSSLKQSQSVTIAYIDIFQCLGIDSIAMFNDEDSDNKEANVFYSRFIRTAIIFYILNNWKTLELLRKIILDKYNIKVLYHETRRELFTAEDFVQINKIKIDNSRNISIHLPEIIYAVFMDILNNYKFTREQLIFIMCMAKVYVYTKPVKIEFK